MNKNSIDSNTKNSVSNKTKDEIKKELLNKLNESTIKSLESKITDIINPKNEKFEEYKTNLINYIFDGISGFSWEYEDELLTEIIIFINSVDWSNINDNLINELRLIYPDITEKGLKSKADYIINTIKDDLEAQIKQYISDNTISFSEIMLIDTSKSFYSLIDSKSIKNDSSESIEKILIKINDIIGTTLNLFPDLSSYGNNIIDRILDNIKTAFDIKKLNFTHKVVNWTSDKLTNFAIKVNNKIGEIFCSPRVSLDETGYHISMGVDLGELKIGNTTLGNIGYTIDTIKGATSILKANSSIARLKAESNINNTINKSEANVPIKSTSYNNKTSKNNKKEESKEKTVKDRKEIDDRVVQKDPDVDEPKEEKYDNTIPSRANIKQDPRRESQELILWEGKGGGYVLLRSKCGSYLLLDENGTVRLQSSTGSVIQLTNNGNIDIDASSNLRLNCNGASYIKQF